MKTVVLLRHVRTKLYYSGWHGWTEDVGKAVDFVKPESAFQRARSEMLSQVEVVTRREDAAEETVQPVVDPSEWT